MKFRLSDAFFRTITKWIRDGWELRAVHSTPYIEQFLLAKDGNKENFVLFYNQKMYDNDTDLIAAAE